MTNFYTRPGDTGSWGDDPENYQLKHYTNGVAQAKKRRTVIDCGAHIGIFTRRFARDFENVIAVEPTNGDYLKRNTQHLNNVTRVYSALSNREGSAWLTTHDQMSSGEWSVVDYPTEWPCAVTTINLLGASEVDYIKVDTQALEREVLEGGKETILEWRPVIHVETRDKQLLKWIETEFDYVWTSKYIKDHILLPRS